MKPEDFAYVVELFHEAALQPEHWRTALHEIGRHLGAEGTCLMAWPGPHTQALWSEGLDALAKVFFDEGWYARNARMARAVALRHTKPVLRESDLFSPEELDTLPFNVDFINRMGFRWVAGTFIGESRGMLTAFVAERKAKAEPFGSEEVAVIEALNPHMRRAAEIASRLGEAKNAGMLDAFEELGCAAILLDFSGGVQHMNKRARQHLGQGLHLLHRQLSTAQTQANHAFQQLIADLLRPPSPQANAPVLANVPRQNGRPLFAYGMPVARSAQEIFQHSKAILILVDPDEHVSPPETVLRHGFKLTPAESRLALALGEGDTLNEFAMRQGVSVGTARIQLKAVMAKTSTRRQSELVALLARLSRTNAKWS
jgi:DNA-binding CsgD family transcriptional regulator